MTRIYGRIDLDRGYHSDTLISISDNGWVHVAETGRWYPPNKVQWIEPAEDQPEGEP